VFRVGPNPTKRAGENNSRLEPNTRVEMLRRTSLAMAPLHKQSLGVDELKNAFINPEAHGFARLSRRISTYA